MERYVLDSNAETIDQYFGVLSDSESLLEPTFNAATGHLLPIISSNIGKPKLEAAIWGLTYGPQKVTAMGVEDIASNPAFMDLLKTNACIIPVSGFYVWKKTVSDPLPFFVRIHSREILAVAGMWKQISESRKAYVVITRQANVLLKPLGESMPCIIDPEDFNNWLHGNATQVVAKKFAHNSFMPDMTVFRVPDLVNDTSNNSKELIQ
ncbi:MAG: SOS response-associated peptidase, partial [Balneolales bacterium]|nr:SOS response-associated peptidase [Balneolales bacterium]